MLDDNNFSKSSDFHFEFPVTPPSSAKDAPITLNHAQYGCSQRIETSMEPSEDGSSSFSHSAFDPTTRPILSPEAPSSRRGYGASRPPSPTRKLLGLLERASLPIKCCQPGRSGVKQPAEAAELRKILSKDVRSRAIPRTLEVCSRPKMQSTTEFN